MNLYGFVENNGINQCDELGLAVYVVSLWSREDLQNGDSDETIEDSLTDAKERINTDIQKIQGIDWNKVCFVRFQKQSEETISHHPGINAISRQKVIDHMKAELDSTLYQIKDESTTAVTVQKVMGEMKSKAEKKHKRFRYFIWIYGAWRERKYVS